MFNRIHLIVTCKTPFITIEHPKHNLALNMDVVTVQTLLQLKSRMFLKYRNVLLFVKVSAFFLSVFPSYFVSRVLRNRPWTIFLSSSVGATFSSEAVLSSTRRTLFAGKHKVYNNKCWYKERSIRYLNIRLFNVLLPSPSWKSFSSSGPSGFSGFT